jgi:hypothetical protein
MFFLLIGLSFLADKWKSSREEKDKLLTGEKDE